jgi:hypothetical protein
LARKAKISGDFLNYKPEIKDWAPESRALVQLLRETRATSRDGSGILLLHYNGLFKLGHMKRNSLQFRENASACLPIYSASLLQSDEELIIWSRNTAFSELIFRFI